MHKGVPHAVVVHVGGDPVGCGLGLVAARAHAHALCAALEHGDVDFGVAHGNSVGHIGLEVVHEHMHRVRLVDTLHTEVAKERMLALAAPGVGHQIGELLDGVEVVLIAREDEAHLVEVVAVELATVDEAVGKLKRALLGVLLGGALAERVLDHDLARCLAEVLARKETIVGLEVELKTTAVQPVHDMAALLERDELMHDHVVVVLHVAAVAANHAVEPDLPDLGRVLGLAAAGAHVDAVPVGAGELDGRLRRLGNVVLVVGDGAVHVEEDDLLVGHCHPSFLPSG